MTIQMLAVPLLSLLCVLLLSSCLDEVEVETSVHTDQSGSEPSQCKDNTCRERIQGRYREERQDIYLRWSFSRSVEVLFFNIVRIKIDHSQSSIPSPDCCLPIQASPPLQGVHQDACYRSSYPISNSDTRWVSFCCPS